MSSIPVPKDNTELKTLYFETKRKEFEEGCAHQKSADACFSLGEWHQLVAKNEPKASEIYAENCLERDHPSSCFNLAMLLLSNRIILPNYLERSSLKNESQDTIARQLLQRGCNLREGLHGQACSGYATMCLSGTGGPRDISTALTTLTKLCDAPYNDARACVKLGSVYLRGESAYPGVQKDVQTAFQVMKRACDELGHPNGCQVLAVMYSKGDGVQKDEALAKKYMEMTKDLMKKTGEKLGNVALDPSVPK